VGSFPETWNDPSFQLTATSDTFVGTLSLSALNVDNNDLLHDQNWFPKH